ncbi:MAG: hypothetical protein BWK78_02145 [Thiotrichaceae bacterium IS1]|nr:MAG: hypothetical protein BWK78_02145 [Thiotrichaceae bacterium IS1]
MWQWKNKIEELCQSTINSLLHGYNNRTYRKMVDKNNPYENVFIGRKSIISKVQNILDRNDRNRFVLYGHPRIGKTYILEQLKRELAEDKNNTVVLFDFSAYVDSLKPSTFSTEYIKKQLIEKISDQSDEYIKKQLIEKISDQSEGFEAALADIEHSGKRLVFLFDEFQDCVPTTSDKTEGTFFQYLQQRKDSFNYKHVNFVFAVRQYNSGRIDRFLRDCTLDSQAQVSLFSKEETEDLICLSKDKEIDWQEDAVESVWERTSGHPYLTNQLCLAVWNLRRELSTSTPIEKSLIDDAIKKDINNMGIKNIISDLSIAERIVISIVSTLLDENMTGFVEYESLEGELNKHESFKEYFTSEAITSLKKASYLVGTDKRSYYFKIKLLGQWAKEYLTPENHIRAEIEEKESLRCKDGIAQRDCESGMAFLKERKKKEAKKRFQESIARAPVCLGPNLELLKIQLEDDQSVEEAYNTFSSFFARSTDEDVVCSLLSKLVSLPPTGIPSSVPIERQYEFLGAILDIFKDCAKVKERYQAICKQFGDEARTQKNLKQAKEYYQKAELPDKVAEVNKEIWEQHGNEAYEQKNLEKALEFYQKAGLEETDAKIRDIWNKLGHEFDKMGKLEEALKLYQKTQNSEKIAEIQEKISLDYQGNKAFSKAKELSHKRELSKAQEFCQEALEFYQRVQLTSKVALVQQFLKDINIMTAREKLIELFDEITTDKDNDVVAVFVTVTTGQDTDVVLYHNSKDKEEKEVSTGTYEALYGGLIETFTRLVKGFDTSKSGELEDVTFRFKDGGTIIVRLGKGNPVYLFFVATGTNMAGMSGERRRNMPKIRELLQQLKIDC